MPRTVLIAGGRPSLARALAAAYLAETADLVVLALADDHREPNPPATHPSPGNRLRVASGGACPGVRQPTGARPAVPQPGAYGASWPARVDVLWLLVDDGAGCSAAMAEVARTVADVLAYAGAIACYVVMPEQPATAGAYDGLRVAARDVMAHCVAHTRTYAIFVVPPVVAESAGTEPGPDRLLTELHAIAASLRRRAPDYLANEPVRLAKSLRCGSLVAADDAATALREAGERADITGGRFVITGGQPVDEDAVWLQLSDLYRVRLRPAAAGEELAPVDRYLAARANGCATPAGPAPAAGRPLPLPARQPAVLLERLYAGRQAATRAAYRRLARLPQALRREAVAVDGGQHHVRVERSRWALHGATKWVGWKVLAWVTRPACAFRTGALRVAGDVAAGSEASQHPEHECQPCDDQGHGAGGGDGQLAPRHGAAGGEHPAGRERMRRGQRVGQRPQWRG
jgi:hypothetical protein